jgi:hypothetical protein
VLCIKRHPTARLGYIVQPEFFIYQHRFRRELLELAMEYFQVGRIRPKPRNPDVLVYSVIARRDLSARVVPFFRDYMRYSARKADFERFAAALRLFEAGVHRTPSGLALIVDIAYTMNMNGKQRRVAKRDIVDRILRGHTPDALGRAKIWSDLHGDMES